MAHAEVLGVWEEVFRTHTHRVLRDFIEALTLFNDLDKSDDSWKIFDVYIDDASMEIINRLGALGPASRRRIANLVSSVKADGRMMFKEAVEQARIGQRECTAGMSSSELDDRLPLGRRAAFDRDLAHALQETKNRSEPCALVMMDIDHFKLVNDTHGHPVGDEVLLGLARRVVARVSHKGRAYRYGGEEFAVILQGYSAEEAFGMAERIRKDIEREPISSKAIHVTASFGVASMPDQARDIKKLLELADAALYESKHNGRNQVRIAE